VHFVKTGNNTIAGIANHPPSMRLHLAPKNPMMEFERLGKDLTDSLE
jgi:hypothetical protein